MSLPSHSDCDSVIGLALTRLSLASMRFAEKRASSSTARRVSACPATSSAISSRTTTRCASRWPARPLLHGSLPPAEALSSSRLTRTVNAPTRRIDRPTASRPRSRSSGIRTTSRCRRRSRTRGRARRSGPRRCRGCSRCSRCSPSCASSPSTAAPCPMRRRSPSCSRRLSASSPRRASRRRCCSPIGSSASREAKPS